MIRNILDFARAMLLASNLPIRFWGDAVLHANYVLIRIPTSANVPRISPYEAAYKKAPYLGDLVPFGAKCTVLVSHKYGRQKKNEPEGSHTWRGPLHYPPPKRCVVHISCKVKELSK
jgi:hypothetical protein